MYIIILLTLLVSSVHALEIPMDFLYKDKLIDPNCILESNILHNINLEECSQHKGKFITSYVLDGDMYGYKYIDENNTNYPGSIAYKYLGKTKDLHVVHAFAIGGEIGRLSYINYFKINKNTLKLIKRGPAGDRSFGGIYDAKIKYGSLIYDMALTPKLFMLNFCKDEKYKPYIEFLPDCAVCQFALVSYKDNKIQSVKLNTVINEEQSDSKTKCFNNIHKKYIDHNKLTLTPEEAYGFVSDFTKLCTSK